MPTTRKCNSFVYAATFCDNDEHPVFDRNGWIPVDALPGRSDFRKCLGATSYGFFRLLSRLGGKCDASVYVAEYCPCLERASIWCESPAGLFLGGACCASRGASGVSSVEYF